MPGAAYPPHMRLGPDGRGDSLRGIRDRLAPILVGQTDAAVVHRMLSEELAELSKAPAITTSARRE